MQPGARYDSHSHEDDEECLVIEGDLVFGHLTVKAGDFHFALKGRTHPPAYGPSG
jgi:quercetin dioxygenase-like cupin family protein